MKKTLSGLFWALLAGASPLISVAQTWTFRAGFGQPGTEYHYADEGRAICTDAAGNVYVTGWFNDDLEHNRTVSFGGTPLISAEDDDGFVAKFNANGVHQWSIRFGGEYIDQGRGIATDGVSVYVVGHGYGPITVGTLSDTYSAPGGNSPTNNDGIIIKLNAATGAVQWVTRFGGPQHDEAQAVCLDNAGNVYVAGIFSTNTSNPLAQFGPFQRTVQGNTSSYSTDMFVARLNSDGVFQWVSTGGIEGGNDNINGSGICYVPGTNQVVAVGSMRTRSGGSTNAVYSTASPSSAVLLTHSGSAVVNEDFVLLELSAATGAFETGFAAGASGHNELGHGVTYDPYSGGVFFAGSFSSASVTFPGLPAIVNTSPGRDNIMYGRYNPSTNTFGWVREVDNGGSTTATDRAMAITANGFGRVLITGRFNNTITFPGNNMTLSATDNTDLFVARINVINGEADYVTKATGNHAQATDVGYGIAAAPDGKCWITGVYAGNMDFPGLPTLSSSGGSEDIVLAAFADAPTIIASPQPVTGCAGSAVEFGALVGGSNLNISWQEATDADFTTNTTLSDMGVYSGTNTSVLKIADVTGLNGRYYRAVVTNAGGTMRTNGALLTTQNPTLAGNSIVQQNVNDQNVFFSANCALLARIVPAGSFPVTGTVTTRVWVEPGMPEVNTVPFGQRHYQIVPDFNATLATARITLYFTQQEFDNFNAHPNSILKLPTGPGDVVGISNLRIGKHPGTSNDGSGMPLTYDSGAEVLDPADADIIYNPTFNRWEVTFDVTGFSGFFLQTATTSLPVNLIAFSAQWHNSNDVQLSWKTAGEIEHSHFEVERSLNGNHFTSIGQAPGRNSTGVEQYAFTDVNAAAAGNKLYYRLKIVSTSGKIEYSKVVVVVRNNPASLVTAILPNPFTDAISFGIQAPQSGRLNVTLTDITGRRLVQRSLQVEKGFSTQTVANLGHLSKGVYTLTVETGEMMSTHKVIK